MMRVRITGIGHHAFGDFGGQDIVQPGKAFGVVDKIPHAQHDRRNIRVAIQGLLFDP